MKVLLSVVAGALLVASGVAANQESQDTSALEPRVAALEQEVGALQAENAELRALMEQTVTYLQAQAKASEAMLATIEKSEAEGFTAGINFRSREILLAGFRDFWGNLKKGAPAPKKAQKADEPAPGARAPLRRP